MGSLAVGTSCPAGVLETHPSASVESVQEIVPFSAVALADLDEVFQSGRPMRLDMSPGKAYLNLIHPSVTAMRGKPCCFQLLLPMDRLLHSSPSPGHHVLLNP